MPSSRITATSLHRERFVDLEEVDVLQIPADLLRDLADGFDRRHHHQLRRQAARRLADDARERREPERAARVLSDVTTSAAAPSLTPGALPAVTRAVLLERRLQRAERFDGGVGADRLVAVDDDRVALALRDRDRQDLVLEPALARGVRRLAMGLGRVGVLLRAADLVRLGDASRPTCPCGSCRRRTTDRRGSSSRPACRCPSAAPRGCAARRYGALLIDSMPPATAISMSPVAIPCAASITAFRPEPQTLLIVSAATWSASPPLSAAWRAGFCPLPAWMTLPMMHSSTSAGSMPARATASRTASAPSCGAVKSLSAPRNLPVGRADGGEDDGVVHDRVRIFVTAVGAEQLLQLWAGSRARARSISLSQRGSAERTGQRGAFQFYRRHPGQRRSHGQLPGKARCAQGTAAGGGRCRRARRRQGAGSDFIDGRPDDTIRRRAPHPCVRFAPPRRTPRGGRLQIRGRIRPTSMNRRRPAKRRRLTRCASRSTRRGTSPGLIPAMRWRSWRPTPKSSAKAGCSASLPTPPTPHGCFDCCPAAPTRSSPRLSSLRPELERSVVERTLVRFTGLTERTSTGMSPPASPWARPAATAIQGRGARFIDRIEGAWSTVVGLPVHRRPPAACVK